MIKGVKWYYDAASGDIVYIHITDENDNELTIEVERRRGDRPWKWILRSKHNLMARLV
jgi:hypothetical protein